MGDLSLYRKEIFDFVETLTIKFTKLAELRNNELQYTYDIDQNDPSTWAYYMNMVGEYHESNTMMYIKSIDTGDTIEFTKDNLLNHPKTTELYKVGKDRYNVLLNAYPEQHDLIKSIVYPVSDIQTAIDAEDFTLLAYDKTYLNVNEQYDLIEFLNNYLDYNATKWYVPQFEYEELYPIAFWATLLYSIPAALFSKRIQNIRTANVHTFHVWEYLKSKGLGDYRDILSNKQSLFLYRNINYLYTNKGKESNLLILAENLLKELKVSIVGKLIYHNNADTQNSCLWTPEIISDPIVDYANTPDTDTTTFETVSGINSRMYEADLEVNNDVDQIEDLTDTLSYTTRNILPTKLVEIKRYVIDNKYENILARFLLDSIVRWVVNNKLTYTISIIDDTTGIAIEELSISDALLLIYYSVHKYHMEDPVNIPKLYTGNTGYYPFDKPMVSEKFAYFNEQYPLKYYIDIDNMLSDIPWKNYNLNQDNFMDHMADQFIGLVKHIRYTRASSNKLVHLAVHKLYKSLIRQETIGLDSFTAETTFAEWIGSNELFSSLISGIDDSTTPNENYNLLANNIIETLLPLSNDKFNEYVTTNDSNTSYVYTQLKKLFMQLCSYNIAFLDTDRDSAIYMFLSNIAVDDTPGGEESDEQVFDPTCDILGMPEEITDESDVIIDTSSTKFDEEGTVIDDTIIVDMTYDIMDETCSGEDDILLFHMNETLDTPMVSDVESDTIICVDPTYEAYIK